MVMLLGVITIICLIVVVKRTEKPSTPLTNEIYKRNHRYNH
jgi:hypothetical protein